MCTESSRNLFVKSKNALEDDWRVGVIESFLETRSETCIIEVWTEALGMPDKPSRRQSNKIGAILDSLTGWKRGEGKNTFKNILFKDIGREHLRLILRT